MLAVLAAAAAVAASSAAAPPVTLVDIYLGPANAATSTTLTPTLLLDASAPAGTTLYLVGVDLSAHPSLAGLVPVLPAAGTAVAPNSTAALAFDLAPELCSGPNAPAGFYRILLRVAASASPAGPEDVTSVQALLVVQDLELPPRGYDWCGADSSHVVVITQDDGPTLDPTGTTNIANVLQSLGAVGTFFLTGLDSNLTDRCLRAKALVAGGHGLGTHTYSHPDITLLSDAELLSELVRNDAWIQDCLGVSLRVFRPPFGRILPRQTQFLSSLGFSVAFWRMSLDEIPVDPANSTLQALQNITTIYGEAAANQSLITISHDYNANIVQIFQVLVPYYRSRGFSFITFDDCIDLCGPTPALCKNPDFTNGLDRAWPFVGGVPSAPFPTSNPACVAAVDDPAPTTPAVV